MTGANEMTSPVFDLRQSDPPLHSDPQIMKFLGLCVGPLRLLLDALTLVAASWSIMAEKSVEKYLALAACCAATLATAGPTNRWPLSFPLFLVLNFQVLGIFVDFPILAKSVTVSSILCIALSVVLCILFPPLQLPKVSGPFNVGVIDTFINVSDEQKKAARAKNIQINDHVAVRILYPTDETPSRIPQVTPATSLEFCDTNMIFGAPQLEALSWMLHYWRLITLPIKRNASLSKKKDKYPVIVYSHGLMGTADVYMYQTMSMAAQGYVVLSITHSDRSAVVASKKSGETIHYNFDLVHDNAVAIHAGERVEYVQGRRRQANHRVEEVHAVSQSIDEIALEHSIFANKLDKKMLYLMGHSFGGATVLTAAKRRPDLIVSVLAHDPALDWMPDDGRKALFHPDKLEGLKKHSYTKGSAGYESNDFTPAEKALHEKDLLILFSGEWRSHDWGWSETLERLHERGLVGQAGGVSHVGVIVQAHHQEFSDGPMLTPLWLARSTGVTGARSPLDTAKEIHQRTLRFVEDFERNYKK